MSKHNSKHASEEINGSYYTNLRDETVGPISKDKTDLALLTLYRPAHNIAKKPNPFVNINGASNNPNNSVVI